MPFRNSYYRFSHFISTFLFKNAKLRIKKKKKKLTLIFQYFGSVRKGQTSFFSSCEGKLGYFVFMKCLLGHLHSVGQECYLIFKVHSIAKYRTFDCKEGKMYPTMHLFYPLSVPHCIFYLLCGINLMGFLLERSKLR